MEREGVLAFAALANRTRCLWRETPMRDVGIDGHVEYVDPDGNATGRTVAVQIKSGTSYMRTNSSTLQYYCSAKHKEYWSNYPLPVILIIFDPESRNIYWADARREISLERADPIRIPLHRKLTERTFLGIFSSDGPLPASGIPPADLCRRMLNEKSPSTDHVSFFDLFVNGLTEGGYALYFGMEVYVELLEYNLPVYGIGPSDHLFLRRYIELMIALDLARLDYAWFDEVGERLNLTGQVLGKLTSRGRELVRYLHSLEDRWEVWSPDLLISVAQERFVRMDFGWGASRRLELIEKFKEDFSRLTEAGE
ncbi:DUF4365 domain-containing protein [Micromonospora sp. BQ11]|uniref:DUF4365 domain-containing protein n=1 Tax=Micromonospora sp. BQ11 TaxID=3452212 RepID=UPI003F8B1938